MAARVAGGAVFLLQLAVRGAMLHLLLVLVPANVRTGVELETAGSSAPKPFFFPAGGDDGGVVADGGGSGGGGSIFASRVLRLSALLVDALKVEAVASPWRRLAFLEELVAGDLIGMAVVPQSGCLGVGVALTAVALAHGLYLTVARPYFRWLDSIFSVVNALLSIAQCAAIATALGSVATSGGTWVVVVAAVTWGQNWLFLVQLIIQLGWIWVVQQKREARAAAQQTQGPNHHSDEEESTTVLALPMLSEAPGSGNGGCEKGVVAFDSPMRNPFDATSS